MAIKLINCPTCGGILDINRASNTASCEFCGTTSSLSELEEIENSKSFVATSKEDSEDFFVDEEMKRQAMLALGITDIKKEVSSKQEEVTSDENSNNADSNERVSSVADKSSDLVTSSKSTEASLGSKAEPEYSEELQRRIDQAFAMAKATSTSKKFAISNVTAVVILAALIIVMLAFVINLASNVNKANNAMMSRVYTIVPAESDK